MGAGQSGKDLTKQAKVGKAAEITGRNSEITANFRGKPLGLPAQDDAIIVLIGACLFQLLRVQSACLGQAAFARPASDC
jgi:uncharacterized membrane protein